MKLISATNDNISWIITELESSKSRPKSGDFLNDFPWKSIDWYKVSLEYAELKNLFFFWDGSAWGEPSRPSYRLEAGVQTFMRIVDDPSQVNNVHLRQVKDWLKKYRDGLFQTEKTFLILVGLDKNNDLMMLDGNHRTAAALWWAIESGDESQLPLSAWVGFSPDILNYWYYRRIIQAE